MKERAHSAFVEQIKEQLTWLSEKSWPENVKSNVNKFNQILAAGRKLGVSAAPDFNEDEVKALTELITPFRVLEMKEDARETMMEALIKKGVGPQIFGIQPVDTPEGPSVKIG